MAKFTKKKDGDLPAVSTASLPDIVFMLLFFFMTVTTMKDSSLMVANTLPNASEIKKLEKKDRVIYIYVGTPTQEYQKVFGTEPKIQLNDKFAEVRDIAAFVASERASKREELVPFLITALKVDKKANMGIVGDIKQELRKVNALKINYTTRQGDVSTNF